MKKKLIAGNWKMNGSLASNEALVLALVAGAPREGCLMAVCVPSPYLAQLVEQGRLGMKSGEGFMRWTPQEQAALRARVLVHLKAMNAADER